MAELFKVNAPVRKPLFEGVQGENEARSIQFDITPWVEELGDGTVTATAKRSQDSQPYPVTVTKDGNTVTWKPTSTDTAFAGVGSFQLEYTVDDVLAKTCIWSTMVAPSLDPAGDPPDPYNNWLAEMREIAADAIQAAQDAEQSADEAAASAATVKDVVGNADLLDLFVLENITTQTSGWTYAPSVQRVGTKKGVTFHLRVGDVIGLTDYTNARYYLSWKRGDGTYGVSGWKTADFTAFEEGDYVVLIARATDVDQTSHITLASLFKYQAVAFDWINENVTDIDTLTELPLELNKGYIAADGSHAPEGNEKTVYTQTFPCEYGQSFDISLVYSDVHNGWVACGLYDEKGDFITRALILASATWSNFIEFYDVFTVNNANAKYIAFTWRSYGDCTAAIRTNTKNTLFGLADVLNKWDNAFRAKVNENVKGINHRGYNTIAPENTIPAFKLSKRYGFDIVETDVYFTSDGVPVCLHDGTLNRTARNADGSALSSTVNIGDITYEQALEYDFGIWKGEEYAGTTIPTFEEFLSVCKNIGLKAYIELKAGTENQIKSLVGVAKNYGMAKSVSWISFNATFLGYIKSADNKARLGVITSPLIQDYISLINALKTSENEVFVSQNNGNLTDAIIQMCKDNDLPLELWTINHPLTIRAIDPYITGVTSDNLIAGYELYKANV